MEVTRLTKVTSEQVEAIFNSSDFETHIFFNKSVVVACKPPNGFVVIGVGSCVDPANFDLEKGVEVARKQIKNEIWELEGYLLQNELLLNTEI